MIDVTEAIIRIKGLTYLPDLENKSFKKGDLVYDRLDNTYGYIDMIMENNRYAVRDNDVVEIGIAEERLMKLKLFIPQN